MRQLTSRGMRLCTVVALTLMFCLTGLAQNSTESKSSSSKKKSKSITVKTLAPLLKSKSETLWDKGLDKVDAESLDDEEIVDAIVRFIDRELKDARYSGALGRAIMLLATTDRPDAVQKLEKLLDAQDFRIAMVAADAASISKKGDLLATLMKLPQRREFSQHYGFRRCVMEAVARYHDKEAVDFLINQLGKTDGQLKYEIAMSLQRITGQQFGGIANDWKKWWTTNRNEFEFPSTERTSPVTLNAPPPAIPWDEPRPNFYGMRVYAKRIVFVIDRSGSMRQDVDGVTRLERAQYELEHAIHALTETDSFNIVAFDDRMDVFSVRMMRATAENKALGVQYAYSLTPRGGTACYEPLKMGLEAANDLELILFVSDGEPTAGALVDPSAIVAAISNHNLTQRTIINTLGIDARDQHERFLKGLAEKNGGKLLLVR